MDLGLEGLSFVVTGGSSGIGLATVELLLQSGARVATCARGEDRLRRATQGMDPNRLLAVVCDVRDRTGCEAFVEDAATFLGGMDGLVNNAGEGSPGRLEDLTDTAWRAEIDGKVFSILNPLRASLPYLRSSDSPRVVNVSAVTARQPDRELLAVSAARAAVSNLSRGLAAELVADAILVNTVAVGVIATERARDRHRRHGHNVPFDEWILEEAQRRGVPLGRLGRPEEVAVAIAFLLSPGQLHNRGDHRRIRWAQPRLVDPSRHVQMASCRDSWRRAANQMAPLAPSLVTTSSDSESA
jgi:NAD(P)-dependent dehydrogenase (short-subunit alcohol dehydrogenase family)